LLFDPLFKRCAHDDSFRGRRKFIAHEAGFVKKGTMSLRGALTRLGRRSNLQRTMSLRATEGSEAIPPIRCLCETSCFCGMAKQSPFGFRGGID
jgi:hypothetical protein